MPLPQDPKHSRKGFVRHCLAGPQFNAQLCPIPAPSREVMGWRAFAPDLNGTLFREPLSVRHFLLCRWSPDTAMAGLLAPHPTPARNGLIPLSANPAQQLLAQPATSFSARTRLSSSTATSLLKREPPASGLSRPPMPKPDSSDCCKGLLLALQPGLPSRGASIH